jgi:hypothetical protein
MASNLYIQHTADGGSYLARRSVKQGRKPSGLSKPELFRLYEDDRTALDELKSRLGDLFNKNDFVRNAVHGALRNCVYTELVTH